MLQNDIIFMLAVRNRSEDQAQLFTATPDYILPALLNHMFLFTSPVFAPLPKTLPDDWSCFSFRLSRNFRKTPLLFVFADLLCPWGYSAAQSRGRACIIYRQHPRCSTWAWKTKRAGLGTYVGRSFKVFTSLTDIVLITKNRLLNKEEIKTASTTLFLPRETA